MSRAAQQCQRVTELEELLDKVKTRVQDLEDRYLSKAVQQHSHTQQLQKEKLDAHRRCEILEQKLSKQKEEATQLQRKLHFITKKEEQRLALQRQASQQRSPAGQQ
ncbi:centrosomal protein of 70 kDa-like [Neolamprologus brichardi]|uniref:centrosomal protein of 70 kDa-like n=1 Tax=Neolamprologus brichardi TaxID=32507 RepID=UPI001643F893|nr:centrosomal protein of 70 kDa-like [Neolamprologus brichardi]